MGLIILLAVGFVAGAAAKAVTPQQEKGGWISSIVIGILGSWLGGMIASLIGIQTFTILGELLVAIPGAILVLFIYHKYLADKLNLPV